LSSVRIKPGSHPFVAEAGVKNHSTLEAALGLSAPWKVAKDTFSLEEKRLDISIDFEPGSTFSRPVCGATGAKAYDTQERTWHHLKFFQHQTYLHARVPRVECSQRCGIKTVEVPWTRSRSGFTALFEAFIMIMPREMPVAAIAAMFGEHDTRIWRVLHHHVEEARKEDDFSEVRRVGMDETASRRGHNYISSFFDLEVKRLLYGTEGKIKTASVPSQPI